MRGASIEMTSERLLEGPLSGFKSLCRLISNTKSDKQGIVLKIKDKIIKKNDDEIPHSSFKDF